MDNPSPSKWASPQFTPYGISSCQELELEDADVCVLNGKNVITKGEMIILSVWCCEAAIRFSTSARNEERDLYPIGQEVEGIHSMSKEGNK